jgi:transcriptional regulator with XRE-family HTH domain
MSTRAKRPPISEEKANAAEAIDRLKRAVSVESDADLAALLMVSRTTLSNWRKRNSVPLARLRGTCRRLGVPLEYVLTGRLGADLLAKPLDTELLAYVFRMLERFGLISIPKSDDPGYDPAKHAAAEFVSLLQETRELITETARVEKLSAAEAKRRLLARSPSEEGPQ